MSPLAEPQALDERPVAEVPPQPDPPARRGWGGIVAAIVSVLSFGAVVLWALGQDTPRFPRSADAIGMIVTAVALYAVATIARGWRWHMILRRAKVSHEPVDAYSLVAVGYMGNTVLPARGGEFLRIFLLAGRSDARRREVLGTIVSERVLDAVTLVILFVALTFLGIANSPVGDRPALIAVGVLAVGAAALAAYLWLRRRGRFERFADVVRPVAGASRPLLGRLGAELGTVTLLVWLIEGTIFYLVAQSLDLDVSWIEGCFLLVLTAFFSLIPAAPGYVGTFDAAALFGLHALNVSGGQAVACAILVRFVLFVPVTVAGLILLVVRYGGLKQLRMRARAEA